ncbi:MAG: nucleotide exchange factor GrpE [Candidatus Rokubacteria bacterium RIFCSPLOWO2_12_FULL_71_22]|nr:MAG: nucleotide exchange factor GrpE [Candidatus Rokubacteria bacterium RIFCSPLOWO2_02_FULL_72_37]OGL19765.1 MAG: nucleotide exchange factor GrpE [Candidatus Rokubacteria bacterium RIFCSPLOWO2_12_FULL_71_22]
MDDAQMTDTPSAEDAPASGPRSEIEELRRQLDEKQDRLLRALAETENVRRRAQRDREDYVRYANETMVRDLIPVLDNLDRALEAVRAASRSTTEASGDVPGTGGVGSLLEGVELIQRELLKVLERAGVTRYSAVGQPFDPTRHEAIARVVSLDAPPDTVVAEQLPGYLLNGRVVRAALVAVSGAPDEGDA